MAMASGEQLKSAKIAVLNQINKNKEILFGKVSDALTRETKESTWVELAERAHDLGALSSHRTWDYLRDTTWQNWRKRFVDKREKKEKYDQTGTGPRIVYDEADFIIMEILDSLGKNVSYYHQTFANSSSVSNNATNPINDINDILEIEIDVKNEPDDVTDGGHMYQSENSALGHNGNDHQMDDQDDDAPQDNYGTDEHTSYQSQNQPIYMRMVSGDDMKPPKIISTSSLSALSRASLLRKSAYATVRSTSRKRPVSLTMNAAESTDRELAGLKCRKIRAELELLHRETYKKDLEILQLERSLGLPASNMTRKFYRFSRTNSSIIND